MSWRTGLLWPLGLLLTACAQSFQPPSAADAPAGERIAGRRQAQVHLTLATGYFQYGQYASALDSVQRSLMADPSWDEAYHLRALIRMRLGRRAEAEQDFLRILPSHASDGDVLNNYAWLLCEQGRLDASMAAFERSARQFEDTRAAVPLASAGMCSMNAGRYTAAAEYFGRALQYDAGNETARTQLARLSRTSPQENPQPKKGAAFDRGSIDE